MTQRFFVVEFSERGSALARSFRLVSGGHAF
jgi:hypothetical protein